MRFGIKFRMPGATYRNKDECEHALDRDIRRTNSKNRQVWVNNL